VAVESSKPAKGSAHHSDITSPGRAAPSAAMAGEVKTTARRVGIKSPATMKPRLSGRAISDGDGIGRTFA
jgi:hypothetical protein